ncbi:hypothetical protein CPB84DRAFT_1854167 [Gymnopilus junonius]|uniref:Uncharacterized protein n=1 Tax=Gymnopilus junonius TaxID=109634 RepID=A0A9P5N9X5_GYMJU|nr:hypothetical protein CPB84DRAFT_1854167 [Gymnopilus junonius]
MKAKSKSKKKKQESSSSSAESSRSPSPAPAPKKATSSKKKKTNNNPVLSFPDIHFSDFASVIQTTFGTKISLATVLMLLFSITDNPDVFNLHFRQQHPTEAGENKVVVSGWLIALTNAISTKLEDDRTSTLLFHHERQQTPSSSSQVKLIAQKLDTFVTALSFSPYDSSGNYTHKLLPVSSKKIQPALVICPRSFVCAVNVMYNFHASASAYAKYWNNTYRTSSFSISQAQIWQAFVQESIHTIAAESSIDLELDDSLNIKEVTAEAFEIFKPSDGMANDAQADKKYVKMVVLEELVMGPTHCAYDNCYNDLSNSRGVLRELLPAKIIRQIGTLSGSTPVTMSGQVSTDFSRDQLKAMLGSQDPEAQSSMT